MSSKDATKEVEAEEVNAADAKKDAVKGTKRPADVSLFNLIHYLIVTNANMIQDLVKNLYVVKFASAAIERKRALAGFFFCGEHQF